MNRTQICGHPDVDSCGHTNSPLDYYNPGEVVPAGITPEMLSDEDRRHLLWHAHITRARWEQIKRYISSDNRNYRDQVQQDFEAAIEWANRLLAASE